MADLLYLPSLITDSNSNKDSPTVGPTEISKLAWLKEPFVITLKAEENNYACNDKVTAEVSYQYGFMNCVILCIFIITLLLKKAKLYGTLVLCLTKWTYLRDYVLQNGFLGTKACRYEYDHRVELQFISTQKLSFCSFQLDWYKWNCDDKQLLSCQHNNMLAMTPFMVSFSYIVFLPRDVSIWQNHGFIWQIKLLSIVR